MLPFSYEHGESLGATEGFRCWRTEWSSVSGGRIAQQPLLLCIRGCVIARQAFQATGLPAVFPGLGSSLHFQLKSLPRCSAAIAVTPITPMTRKIAKKTTAITRTGILHPLAPLCVAGEPASVTAITGSCEVAHLWRLAWMREASGKLALWSAFAVPCARRESA